MNDRIRQLTKQAGLYAFVSEDGVDPDIEKFARLIVRECCQVVAEIPVDALEPDYKILADHFEIEFERDWNLKGEVK